jgi:hypothetical protein
VRSWYLRPGTIREPRRGGTFAVGSCYQATASEDVTVDTRVYVGVGGWMCNSVL